MRLKEYLKGEIERLDFLLNQEFLSMVYRARIEGKIDAYLQWLEKANISNFLQSLIAMKKASVGDSEEGARAEGELEVYEKWLKFEKATEEAGDIDCEC